MDWFDAALADAAPACGKTIATGPERGSTCQRLEGHEGACAHDIRDPLPQHGDLEC